ncbi:MAG TPA: hypothetical protein VMH49_07465 [Thermoplasmata archaeon]|nr:hypothetical protein [Thermoplasmata archaeon]
MASCPACGADVPASLAECPGCKLSTSLFEAVRDAAGRTSDTDPAYLATVAELIRSIDLTGAPEPAPPPLLRPSPVGKGPAVLDLPRSEPELHPEPLASLATLPQLPPPDGGDAVRQRAQEYLRLGRRLGLDLAALATRVSAAEVSGDDRALDAVLRELFVNVASALAVAFEEQLTRRREIGQLVPTPSADVELNAIRGSIEAGDLVGADRRLAHVQDELARLEDVWATGRILIASCDMLAETARELGADPEPALGPVREGRHALGAGHRELAERLLARGALALWAIAEPRFFDELKRLRNRLLELRDGGTELAPALAELRIVSTELRRRNFVGTISAYRQLRTFVGPADAAEPSAAVGPDPSGVRSSPHA